MIESGFQSWLSFLTLAVLSSLAGMGLSRCMPWSNAALVAELNLAAGVVFAPFLAGIAAVLALLLLPGANYSLHILFVYCVLTACALLLLKNHVKTIKESQSGELTSNILIALLLIWVALLLLDAIFLPLLQNDSLEYAIVGRELFHARTLKIYPLLDPVANTSGFFAPWTHPPLYVSLIYLMSALQEHADKPGLMRMIAPWFLLAAVYASFKLGRLRNKNTGCIAGVLLISTPLIFLGADSALIDALPMSGMVLLLATMTGLNKAHRMYGKVLGAILGLTLWTHSQALLLIPLVIVAIVLQYGLNNYHNSFRAISNCLLMALLLGGWPYIRNFFLFGSPISDNPAVFGLPELDWSGYFRGERGLSHNLAILQYGVLKGWFNLESYGWLFWLGSAGMILFLYRHSARHVFEIVTYGLDQAHDRDVALWLSMLLVLMYLAGVVLSVVMGIDLMIRNDRYVLVIAPMLALWGAYFLQSLASIGWKYINSPTSVSLGKDAILTGYGLLAASLLLQVIFEVGYYRWNYVFSSASVTKYTEDMQKENLTRFDWLLKRWPSISVLEEIDNTMPDGASVLALRPADMYYSKHRMVSYLDPRLLPFYRERNPAMAMRMLQNLAIRHVFMTDYTLPPAYNSSLLSILADPSLSRLVYSEGMMQWYMLEDTGQTTGELQDLSPGHFPWTRTYQIRTPVRRFFSTNFLYRPRALEGNQSVSSMPLFHNNYSVMLSTGTCPFSSEESKKCVNIDVQPGGEYILRIDLAGAGYTMLWFEQLDASGTRCTQNNANLNGPIRIGDVSFSDKKLEIPFVRRFRLAPNAQKIRFGLEHVGRSHVTIKKMTLERVLPGR